MKVIYKLKFLEWIYYNNILNLQNDINIGPYEIKIVILLKYQKIIQT